jgi:hypothetical protein
MCAEITHFDFDAIDGDGRSRPIRVVPEVAGEHASARPRIVARVAARAGVALALAATLSFVATQLLRTVVTY